MKNINVLSCILMTAAIILSSCGSMPQPSPTLTALPSNTPLPAATTTPFPSNTPMPSATFTHTPTHTPRPTSTATIEPTLALGEPRTVAEGGYSFRPPVDYTVDVQGAQVSVIDDFMTLIISFFGAASNPQDLSADEILDDFTAALFKSGNGEYQKENPQSIIVDGADGLIYDVTGTFYGASMRGQAVIIMPDHNHFVYGLGLNNAVQDINRWDWEGHKIFSGMVNSLTFSTDGQSQSSKSCPVSSDTTYGYTQENPIKVGGDAFGGPFRERAYLDNLLGPNSEKVSYIRTGSIPFGETILDAFEVTAAGKKVTLYVDEYAYTEPQAPAGFTCVGLFLLSEP